MKAAVTLLTIFLSASITWGEEPVPLSAKQIRPIQLGASIPKLTVLAPNGSLVNLNEKIAEKPTVIIFYRGGWSSDCIRHLQDVQQIEDQLIVLGFQVIAISPDCPARLRLMARRTSLNYILLSDSPMDAARAFGVAFQIHEKTVKKLKKNRIDLEKNSEQTHHQLPVPSIFILDTNGQILFRHFNPDDTERLDPQILLATANMMARNF